MTESCNNHNHCVDDTIATAENICHDKSLSLTPLRQKVLKLVLQSGHRPIKAYDVLEELQKDEASAKPTTVYRALDFLMENKLIHKIESQNSFIGCYHPSKQHNCAFLICNKCNEVEECCDNGKILSAIKNSVDSDQFNVENITLEIHGICRNCT